MRMANAKRVPMRRRNISWEPEIDNLAQKLAKGYRGGVSEFLARLVNAESRRKVGVAYRTPARAVR